MQNLQIDFEIDRSQEREYIEKVSSFQANLK